ncbi:MAG: hypothetical protein E7546_02600 [Ruminococcaceae bacterium]|nr:hypothetical protein [Oscillospiraceae bacterium]
MLDIKELGQYKETNRIEAKKAVGGLPLSIWETYSSFANTSGGVILLGVEELEDKTLASVWLPDADMLIEDFLSGLDDKDVVSVNLKEKMSIRKEISDGNEIVVITVPKANKSERPVFIGRDPFAGTYKRVGDGDYRCTRDEVGEMLKKSGRMSFYSSGEKYVETSEADMKEIIKNKLCEIEKAENVKIIYACESGSRAWGFASQDSDYDVRFIYLRRPEYYLRLAPTRDVIEWQLDETLDINGWDMQKALRLMNKSNPTLFEWLNSPIVYRTSPIFDDLKKLGEDCFSAKSTAHHYLSMAKSDIIKNLTGESISLKRYFYMLRSLLACKWVVEKKSAPPVPFDELVEYGLDSELRNIVSEMAEKKKNTAEHDVQLRIEAIDGYLEQNLAVLSDTVSKLDGDVNEWDRLEKFFLDSLSVFYSDEK